METLNTESSATTWGVGGEPAAQPQPASFWPGQCKANPDSRQGAGTLENSPHKLKTTYLQGCGTRTASPAVWSEETALMPRASGSLSGPSSNPPTPIECLRVCGGGISLFCYIRHWLQVLNTLGQGMETNVMKRKPEGVSPDVTLARFKSIFLVQNRKFYFS